MYGTTKRCLFVKLCRTIGLLLTVSGFWTRRTTHIVYLGFIFSVQFFFIMITLYTVLNASVFFFFLFTLMSIFNGFILRIKLLNTGIMKCWKHFQISHYEYTYLTRLYMKFDHQKMLSIILGYYYIHINTCGLGHVLLHACDSFRVNPKCHNFCHYNNTYGLWRSMSIDDRYSRPILLELPLLIACDLKPL